MMRFTSAITASALIMALGAAPAFAQAPGDATRTPASPTTPAPQKPPPKPVDGHIMMQSENTVLASSLIGARVTGGDGEGTAEISDVIIGRDGGIEGVVVSVGGFLGLGAHSVAVKWDKVQLEEQPNGQTKLRLTATRDDLKAAEKFKSKAEIVAEREAEKRRTEQQQQAPRSPVSPPTSN
jgi:sporulation protein YlmC with PRC-barrel domain